MSEFLYVSTDGDVKLRFDPITDFFIVYIGETRGLRMLFESFELKEIYEYLLELDGYTDELIYNNEVEPELIHKNRDKYLVFDGNYYDLNDKSTYFMYKSQEDRIFTYINGKFSCDGVEYEK